MKFKNKFVKIDFDRINKIAHLTWLDTTFFMTEKQYEQILHLIKKNVFKFNISLILNDMRDFKYPISLENDKNIKNFFLSELAKIVKKVAIILPLDYTIRLSVKNFLEDSKGLKIRYFNNISDAETWLFFKNS